MLNFVKRLVYSYLIRNFNYTTLEFIFGILLLGFGVIIGAACVLTNGLVRKPPLSVGPSLGAGYGGGGERISQICHQQRGRHGRDAGHAVLDACVGSR